VRRYVALRPSGMWLTLMNRLVSVPSNAGMPPGMPPVRNPCARQAISSVQVRAVGALEQSLVLGELAGVDVQGDVGGVGGVGDVVVVAMRIVGVGAAIGARHGFEGSFECFSLLE
jgi:hypothetical protein